MKETHTASASRTLGQGRVKVRWVLPATPRLRTVRVAQGYQPLREFSCGDDEHAESVNNLVRRQHDGTAEHRATLVVMEMEPGELLGVCFYRPAPMTFDVLPTPDCTSHRITNASVTVSDAVYIHAIGISEAWRGYRVHDTRRLGAYLLAGTMTEIKRARGGGRMPAVWAFVKPSNAASHRVFDEHGFAYIPPQVDADGDVKRYRMPGQISPPWG